MFLDFSEKTITNRSHNIDNGYIKPFTRYSQCKSFSNKLLFCVARSWIPGPPCSCGSHACSQATRHCTQVTVSSPDHKKLRLYLSRASRTSWGSRHGVCQLTLFTSKHYLPHAIQYGGPPPAEVLVGFCNEQCERREAKLNFPLESGNQR